MFPPGIGCKYSRNNHKKTAMLFENHNNLVKP